MLAPEGLWQIIRIFTVFYNIPVIAVVLVGLFTRRVPALGAKIAIVLGLIPLALPERIVWLGCIRSNGVWITRCCLSGWWLARGDR